MSAPTWNEEFELPDGSYSVSDIQDYFEYLKIFKINLNIIQNYFDIQDYFKYLKKNMRLLLIIPQ